MLRFRAPKRLTATRSLKGAPQDFSGSNRYGDSPDFAPIKMPGLRSVGNVTLRKGVFTKDSVFWDWFKQTQLNIIKRRTVVINLFDEKAEPKMTWTLTNAWPVKLSGTEMKSDSNEVAIESLEIAYETLTVKAG